MCSVLCVTLSCISKWCYDRIWHAEPDQVTDANACSCDKDQTGRRPTPTPQQVEEQGLGAGVWSIHLLLQGFFVLMRTHVKSPLGQSNSMILEKVEFSECCSKFKCTMRHIAYHPLNFFYPPAYVVRWDNDFTSVSLSHHTGGRGYPSPRFFPRSLVPGPFLGGEEVLQSQMGKVPQSWFGGTPGQGYPPWPG